jgi:hypothetical protein
MHKLVALLLCSLTFASPVVAEPSPHWWRAGGPRIRMMDARLTTLLANGLTRSATLRALVDRLDASDVIVYVSLTPLMHSRLAGRLMWMSDTGEFRYLRAQISTELNADQMIATLAHELQHAVEVSEDRAVTDQRSLVKLYQRIGHPSRVSLSSGWETAAAHETGLQVRRELVSQPAVAARRTAEIGQS